MTTYLNIEMPDGEHIVITEEQMHAFLALVELLTIHGRGIEHWHMCVNGCCVMIRLAGYDESEWRVADDGTTELIDRYGNTLETLDYPKGGD